MKTKIYVVRSDIVGDHNNLLGIAAALADEFDGEIEIIGFSLKARFFEPFIRYLIRKKAISLFEKKIAELMFSCRAPSVSNCGRAFLISTLGKGEFTSAYLARIENVFAIHLGRLKRIKETSIDMVLTHPGDVPVAGEFQLQYCPTRVTQYPLDNADPKSVLLLAFGGDAGSLEYPPAFYEDTLDIATRVAKRNGLSLVVTTSHRTGMKNEQHIESHIHKYDLPVLKTEYYNRGKVPDMNELLENTSVALVSAESMSMLSDCMEARAKTIAVYHKTLPDDRRMRGFLVHQAAEGRIELREASDESPINLSEIKAPNLSWRKPFLAQVIKNIDEIPSSGN